MISYQSYLHPGRMIPVVWFDVVLWQKWSTLVTSVHGRSPGIGREAVSQLVPQGQQISLSFASCRFMYSLYSFFFFFPTGLFGIASHSRDWYLPPFFGTTCHQEIAGLKKEVEELRTGKVLTAVTVVKEPETNQKACASLGIRWRGQLVNWALCIHLLISRWRKTFIGVVGS